MSIRDQALFLVFIAYSVPSYHLGSTMGAEIAFCLEETARGQRPGTGDLNSSLLLHSCLLGQREKILFHLPLKNNVPSSTGAREGAENHDAQISSLQPGIFRIVLFNVKH